MEYLFSEDDPKTDINLYRINIKFLSTSLNVKVLEQSKNQESLTELWNSWTDRQILKPSDPVKIKMKERICPKHENQWEFYQGLHLFLSFLRN